MTAVGLACSTCHNPISPNARSGLCRTCINRRIGADPEVKRRKSESLKRYAADPANAAARRAAGKRGAAKRLADPVYAAKAAEFMRSVVQPLSCTPEELAKGYRSECGKKAANTKLAWCPIEHRDDYRKLIASGVRKAEAKPMILEMVKVKALRKRRERERKRQQAENNRAERARLLNLAQQEIEQKAAERAHRLLIARQKADGVRAERDRMSPFERQDAALAKQMARAA